VTAPNDLDNRPSLVSFPRPVRMLLTAVVLPAILLTSKSKAYFLWYFAMSIIWDTPTALCPSRRSLITIIRSCFSTIFICTWVSVHPNIPPMKEGQARALWRRLKMMFWTIVAPELILAWAVRQWLAARRIRDIFNQARKFGVYYLSFIWGFSS